MPKNAEIERLKFIESCHGPVEALEFAKRTYKIYRHALLLSRKRASIRPEEDGPNILINVQFKHLSNARVQNVHHASIPEFRRGFIASCVVFRQYIHNCGLLS